MPSQLDGAPPRATPSATAAPPLDPTLRVAWAAELLCDERERELTLAEGYRECRGLSRDQLEDLFQDTAIKLLDRPFTDALHLYRALRIGIKKRALNVHRNERARRATHIRRALDIQTLAHAQAGESDPERILLASEDKYLIKEFATELSPNEQRLLRLTAEGVSTRRLAKALEVSPEQLYAIKVTYERKRENYTTLYNTGRLCGFRSATITRLKEHQTTSPQLAERAIAHLQNCPRCRAEHQITARRLRHTFEQKAAALLPLPAILTQRSPLTRLLSRIKHPAHHHQKISQLHASQAHSRLAMILANTSTTTRIATPIAATLLTAGAIGATHALTQTAPHPHQPPAITLPALRLPPAIPSRLARATQVLTLLPNRTKALSRALTSPHPFGPGHTVGPARSRQVPLEQHTPGGFAYLGVPATPLPKPSAPTQQTHLPGGGGEFSP